MAISKPLRRLPLRDLLTDAEKRTRDLIEQMRVTFLARAADLRELSRPVRKRSHYPTVHALQNALQKLTQTAQESEELIGHLTHELHEIKDHAKRESARRF